MVFNPAGLASLEQRPRGGDGQRHDHRRARCSYTNSATGFKDDLKDNNYLVPSAYVGYGITDNIAAGLGSSPHTD